jgi:hypothetical protein
MWTNNKDNHYLIENLVRETTKNCYGYLELWKFEFMLIKIRNNYKYNLSNICYFLSMK